MFKGGFYFLYFVGWLIIVARLHYKTIYDVTIRLNSLRVQKPEIAAPPPPPDILKRRFLHQKKADIKCFSEKIFNKNNRRKNFSTHIIFMRGAAGKLEYGRRHFMNYVIKTLLKYVGPAQQKLLFKSPPLFHYFLKSESDVFWGKKPFPFFLVYSFPLSLKFFFSKRCKKFLKIFTCNPNFIFNFFPLPKQLSALEEVILRFTFMCYVLSLHLNFSLPLSLSLSSLFSHLSLFLILASFFSHLSLFPFISHLSLHSFFLSLSLSLSISLFTLFNFFSGF